MRKGRGILIALLVLVVSAPAAFGAPPKAAMLTMTRYGGPTRHEVMPLIAAGGCRSYQRFTVLNWLGASVRDLERAERAVADQSRQVARWWGTPCVEFAPGGWKVYLKSGIGDAYHASSGAALPFAVVPSMVPNVEAWVVPFSHEVAETLADPVNRGVYYHGEGVSVEIADPVEDHAYRLDGVYVTDFVLPDWFAGATTGASGVDADGNTFFDGPTVPAAGPWDEMHLLKGPWRGVSGQT